MNDQFTYFIQIIFYFFICYYCVFFADRLCINKTRYSNLKYALIVNIVFLKDAARFFKNRSLKLMGINQYFAMVMMLIVNLRLIEVSLLQDSSWGLGLHEGIFYILIVNLIYAFSLFCFRINTSIVSYFDNCSVLIFKLVFLQTLANTLIIQQQIIDSIILVLYFLYSVKISFQYLLKKAVTMESSALKSINALYIISTTLILSKIYLLKIDFFGKVNENIFIFLVILVVVQHVLKRQECFLSDEEIKSKINQTEVKLFLFLVYVRIILWLI